MKPEEAAAEIINRLMAAPSTNETSRRELFIVHLGFLFPQYAWQISEYALGAEKPVKIPGKKLKKTVTGRIDTHKGALLIEYKTDLSSSVQQKKAENELREYVAGLVNKEKNLASVARCISTDIIRWHHYEVSLEPQAQVGRVTANDVILEQLSVYRFSAKNPQRFVEVVERLVFEDVPLVATGNLLVNLFGLQSKRYSQFMSSLKRVWSTQRNSPEAKLGLKLWSEYLENHFDKKLKTDENSYLDHVYLVILARMIAASSLSNPEDQSIEDFPLQAVTGEFFNAGAHRVDRFVEEDFFRWTKSESVLSSLKSALQSLHNELQKLDFRSAKKLNILSELYEQIMPAGHKAEYGEILTPAWLTEKIVNNIPACGRLNNKILDPACGTGSFLRAVIEKKLSNIPKHWNSQKVLETILSDICGLDINPIAVIIAKTTLMLSLAEWLSKSDKPIEIPVYLCDSLFLPEGFISQTKGKPVVVSFDGIDIKFPPDLFVEGTSQFDKVVDWADRYATLFAKKELPKNDCERSLTLLIDNVSNELQLSPKAKELLHQATDTLLLQLSKRIVSRRNNIWAFVLRNTYKPSLLKARFDVVICNPPWLAVSSFPALRYKKQLEALIESYKLTPAGASRHHMEIATVFALHCNAHYVRKEGKSAFVLPRVILKGYQHDPLRRSMFKRESPFKVIKLWDFEGVNPLFGRPACVIFGQNQQTNAGFPDKLSYVAFSGDPISDKELLERKGIFTLSILGKKSAFESKISGLVVHDIYISAFHQGADLMPRRAVIVDIIGSKTAKVLSVRTSANEIANPNNKPPWNEIDLQGTIESEFLFCTLKSDAILPFVTGDYSYVTLPVEKSNSRYRILTLAELATKNYAMKWFRKIDKELAAAGGKKLESWLSRRNKLVDQSSEMAKHLVVYGAGGKNAAATVVDTTKIEFPFVNDQTLYVWDAPSKEEAWYVCGMLNSSPINKDIKSYQPSGQFGEQHIHKLPLLLIPKFDKNNTKHVAVAKEAMRLSKIARSVSAKDSKYLNVNKPLAYRRRSFVKKLGKKLDKLNKLTSQILRGDG